MGQIVGWAISWVGIEIFLQILFLLLLKFFCNFPFSMLHWFTFIYQFNLTLLA
jgi:ABC-type multidrug transport system permease subunit